MNPPVRHAELPAGADAAFDQWFTPKAREHRETHGEDVPWEIHEAVRRAFGAGWLAHPESGDVGDSE